MVLPGYRPVYISMLVLESICKVTLLQIATLLLLIASTYTQQTKPYPISFDELRKDVPVVPASPTVVDIVDRPSYSQNPTPSKQLGPIQTESPTRIDNRAGKDTLTKIGGEEQEKHSQLVWIIIAVCSVIIIGGISLLLIKRFRNKNKIRMRLQEEIQKHIELQEKSEPSFSDFPSQ